MYILGISAFYHDSAAALIKDGQIILALEEERLTRIKHDNSFPVQAIKACLQHAHISEKDLSYIAYYERPLRKFERILDTFISTYPRSLNPFIKTLPEWFGEKIKIESKIRKTLNYQGKIHFIPHHLSHASAAFYSSRFKKASILTIDGVGEYQTTGLWLGDGKKIEAQYEINFPHSLGLLYSTFTAFLGFRVNDDEYKIMGMAAYGRARFKSKIYELIDIKEDGSFRLDLSYFSYRESFKMWSNKFEQLFGDPRKKSEKINQRHKDMASSIQEVTEEIYLKMLNHLYKLNKTNTLCLGGGVALNALANGKIYKNTPFKKVYAFGASGDSGGAFGAALYAYHATRKSKSNVIQDLRIGNTYKGFALESIINRYNLRFRKYDEEKLVKIVANLLAKGKIIGWFQGKMEFGPRALGARSIISSPYPFSMKEKVNVVKRREQFRPFAGSVLEEKAQEFFDLPSSQNDFPFMNFCFYVKDEMKKKIPAITHKDNTCRIQTVNKSNGIYYSLIKEFGKITGTPVLLNTSFNIKGEPIVESPEQAIKDYLRTKIDYLVIEDYFLYKRTHNA